MLLTGARDSWITPSGLFFFPFKMEVGKVYPKVTEGFCKHDTTLPPPKSYSPPCSNLPFVDFLSSTKEMQTSIFGAFKSALILLSCVTVRLFKGRLKLEEDTGLLYFLF